MKLVVAVTNWLDFIVWLLPTGNSNSNSKHSGHQQVEMNSSHGGNLTSKSSGGGGGGKGSSNSSSPSPRSSSNAHGSSRNSSTLGALQTQQGRNSHNLIPQQQQQQQHRAGLCRSSIQTGVSILIMNRPFFFFFKFFFLRLRIEPLNLERGSIRQYRPMNYCQ